MNGLPGALEAALLPSTFGRARCQGRFWEADGVTWR